MSATATLERIENPPATAPHVLAGKPTAIPRGNERAYLQSCDHPTYSACSPEHAAKVADFNEKVAAVLRRKREGIVGRIETFASEPESITIGDIFALRDVVDQEYLDYLKERIVAMRQRCKLASETVADLQAVVSLRQSELPKAQREIKKKLARAGVTAESTRAGQMGQMQAAERQLDYQVRQHQDYVAAHQAVEEARSQAQAAAHFERVAAECVDLAVQSLNNFVAGIARQHVRDL